jgi:hypothetical protein
MQSRHQTTWPILRLSKLLYLHLQKVSARPKPSLAEANSRLGSDVNVSSGQPVKSWSSGIATLGVNKTIKDKRAP